MRGDTLDSSDSGSPDPEIEAQRVGHTLAQESTDRLAADPLDELSDQPPVGERVVSVGCPGLPQRMLRGQRLDDRADPQHVFQRWWIVDGR